MLIFIFDICAQAMKRQLQEIHGSANLKSKNSWCEAFPKHLDGKCVD